MNKFFNKNYIKDRETTQKTQQGSEFKKRFFVSSAKFFLKFRATVFVAVLILFIIWFLIFTRVSLEEAMKYKAIWISAIIIVLTSFCYASFRQNIKYSKEIDELTQQYLPKQHQHLKKWHKTMNLFLLIVFIIAVLYVIYYLLKALIMFRG